MIKRFLKLLLELEFRRNFGNAIIASRDPKATDKIVKEGKEKADELNRITNGFILRRTQAVIGSFLPNKNEYVVFCAPSLLQVIYLCPTSSISY